MFYMVSKYGNAHKKVESERKRDELIAMGYHEVEEPVEEERGVEDVAPYEGPQQADDPLQMYTTEDDAQDAATDEDDAQDAATDEGAQAAAGGDNTTEDDAQDAATDEDDAQDAATDEGAQAAAGGDNTTEDDAQAEVNPKKRKTKKNDAEE